MKPSTERDLAEIWQELLAVAPAGTEEDFFAAGGDSILAAALIARACARLDVDVELSAFVRRPTIAALAGEIDAAKARGATATAWPVAEDAAPARCSYAQERFWFIDQASGSNVVSNVSWALRLDGPLDVPALERALAGLALRHDALRTRFELRDGTPVQIVSPESELTLELAEVDDEAHATRLAAATAQVPFDLGRGPLLRAQLLVLGADSHVLQLTAHHIICDDWSKGVILSDLSALYAALLTGEEPSLAAPVQYPDFARWQRARLSEEALHEELEHWRARLTDAPAAELPVDRRRPPTPSMRGARLRTTVPPEVEGSLRALGLEAGATFFMTMLAALQGFLLRYTRQEDLVVGTAVDNRGRVELEHAMGLFTNVLALRTDVSGRPSFRELMARARETTLDAIAHQALPFDRLAATATDRDASRHPIFQVFYEFIVPAPLELTLPGVRSEPFEVPKRTSEFDLGLYLDEQRGGLDAVWEYSSDLFEPATIERMAEHFLRLLGKVVDDPDRPIDELALLDEEQRSQALLGANVTETPVPRSSIQELFEGHVRRAPEEPALLLGDEQLSYGELNRRANAIAHLLIARGVKPADAVGLCLDRSADLVCAMLGILKAGGAYVPLNPDHPSARLLAQLDTAEARMLIAQEPLEGFDGELISLEHERAHLDTLPSTDPGLAIGPHDMAYVLFTSGSTGVPKGVAVTHRNLVNYAAHMIGMLGENGTTSGLQFGSVSAVSTDLGNTAIFPALAGGGCLHLIASEVSTDGAAFAAYTAERPLDVLKITPSHLSSLLDAASGASILPRRWLILGGEALSWELAQRVRVTDGPRVINHYGPTEATIGCCTYEPDLERAQPPARTVPIGRPISNATAYVLDSLMQPVPLGVAGELYIGGAGVARGYVNQPAQTAQVFLSDPFSEDPDARLYRTGDLARRLPEGSLEFLGRADQQVKIRGFRVEPAEVQAALMREPGVRQAAVLADGDGDGKRLVAYVVADEGTVSPSALGEALARTLPAYMVPSQIALLDALPLTPNGKLDRSSLPSLDAPLVAARTEPLSELEQEISAVWAELLDREVGPDENFFEVGGHSLLAIRLIARMRTDLGVKLTLKALIDAPTISEFATRIETAQQKVPVAAGAVAQKPAAPPKPVPTVPRVPREGPLRCSFAQEQFWLVDQLTPGTPAYNFSWPMRLKGSLDTDALGKAVAALVARHEALRTRFTATDGQPMQIVEKASAAGLELVDLAAEPDPEGAAAQLIDEQTAAAFDLARGPLLRVLLMRLGEQEHILLIVVHHIVFDGVSKVVLYRELGECYEAYAAGHEPSLGELAIQYGDYAEWQRSQLDPERLERELQHWQTQLQGAPTALELPTDRPRPAVSSLRGARYRHPLSGDLRGALDTLARGEGATFFMAVLAAFEVLLYRYTGQEDLLVGTPVDTRTVGELAPIVGPFINTVVIRGELSGTPSFRELLRRVQQRTVDALEHQELSFERLVARIAPERDLSRHPLFQALLALNPAETGLALEGVEVSDIDPAWSGARVDLFLIFDDLPQGLEAIWEYSSDLFEPATIERMAGHFVRLLEEIVADPDRPIEDLTLLGERERALLLDEWNATDSEFPRQRLEQLVAEHARTTPDRVAVQFDGRELTYGELEARANRLANRLQVLGAGPDELVGVCLNRSEELLVALLGTMKTGAAYVPIDPGFPPARQEFMLADAQVRVLVTEEALLASLPVVGAEVLCLDRDSDEIARESSSPPVHDADADGLAYVIYTSGSTGKPKGVEISHRALVNLLCAMRESPGLAAEDVLVAVTTLSFDIAGLELYVPLIAGARVVIASAQTAADPRALARLLESSGATAMQATPTTWRMLIDSGWSGGTGLKALCGGEALPPALADELVTRVAELWNMYGPTETTIWSTCARVNRPSEPPTIGRPIANTTLHIFDKRGRPAPIGVPGELVIGGAGLARGYRNRPELTAERFVTGESGERMYRTGDLARYRPDGTVQFLGRLDHQIKLRGFRIELGEIEAVLDSHPAVAAAAATVHDGARGEPALIAYVVADGEPVDTEELCGFLGESLPGYMVPATVVALERLPLTPNGKIDRKALPAPELAGPSDDQYVEPRNATEETVASVFCEVLGVERAGAHDDFFGLGGQSLLAARLVSRLDARFEIELPLRALFEAPTVAGLAARIEQLRTASSHAPQATVREPLSQLSASAEPPPLIAAAGVRPASFAQERFWFIDQIGAGAAYNISWPLRLRGELDVVALERALNEIVRRHEILRSRLAVEDGRPVQVIEPSLSIGLEFVDLSDRTDLDSEAQRLIDERTQAPFDLGEGPLISACLLRLGPSDHILQVVVHHAVADGGSKVVFFNELGALYGAYRDNRPASLAQPPIQYADFAQWQRSTLQGERLDCELAHWTRELQGIPAGLELPSDHPRPEVPSLRGAWLRTKLADDTLQRLNGLARAEGATLFMVLLAAFEVLLHRYSGQDDVVVGTPVDTRGRPELEQLIGPFVNTLVLRGDLSGTPSFRELLERVKRCTLDAIEHQELPFERLVEMLAPERELSRHPLFQALIALNPPEPAIQLQGLEVEELDTEKTASRVDLTLLLQQREQGLELIWEYSSDLFEPATLQRMADHFVRLLDSIVAHPEQAIDELSLLREGEREQLLATFDEGERTFPVFCLHERFEEQARQTPDAVAISHDGESLTYRELNVRANRLAHHLRSLGVQPDALIALCLERSFELVVAVLAVLKAGGAYVPLDPEYPIERLAFVLGDCEASVLVTQESLLQKLTVAAPASVVCVDRDAPSLERESEENPPPAAGPENLAYVIYTSGSTGQPKGVLVEHRNVARLFTSTDEWFAPGLEDTWTLLHSYAFDFSVWEIWGALLHGGTLVVVPTWTARSPDALARLLVDERVTVLNVTPSLFMTAMDELLAVVDDLSLRLVIFGGEALHTRLLAPWFERAEETRPQLVNMYGITETTVHVTYRPLTAADAQRDGSPIGRPLPDLELYVLDAKLKPVPAGVAGELFVGGAGVARGYLNRPELTEQRFIANPFATGRLYRTGDRARFSTGRELLFEGRLDDQVKIRGFRIELGEVQAALAADATVAECAVIAERNGSGSSKLAAYVVPAGGAGDPASLNAELRERLRDKLPDHMVPSSFTLLDVLPLTPNGKLDRRALPAPSEARDAREPLAPRTELERELADLWRELLGVEIVGVEDDFFELGGHSLLAAQLAARVRARLGVDCSVRAVFEAPTIAGLARVLGQARDVGSGSSRVASAITGRRAQEAWPLSYSQQQLWLIDQWDPGAPTYNVALPFRVRGVLDMDALRAAVTGVLARHEALRTVVHVQDDQPLPVLLEDPRVELEPIDLSGRSQEEALQTLTGLARRPFDLARDPLLRCSVIRTGEDEQIVLIETHHIAFDGFSERVLLDELAALYRGKTLPDLPLQFGDFALWQHSWLEDEEVEDGLGWWRKHLAGASTSIELPVDRPRPEGRRFTGESHELALPGELAAAVRHLCREESATPYMLVLAALTTMLYRLTGQDDILIGSPVANRMSPELETLIGFFSNTLVFRVRMSGNPTFRELLRRTREMALDVYSHQGVPFEKIVEAVAPEREPGVNPLFQVNLRVSTASRPALELAGLQSTPLKVDSGLARFDLALDLDVLEDAISGYFRYNRDIFEPATIARLSNEFETILREALIDPDRPLLSFDLQGEWSERRSAAGGLRGFRAKAREGGGAA